MESYYSINFRGTKILTTVTSSPKVVDQWISTIYQIHYRRMSKLILGLDIEWVPYFGKDKPNPNPVAIIQICVGHRCLIFQLLQAHSIPYSLRQFLAIPEFTFVGVGVKEDANKLFNDWNLKVECTMDLAEAAADKYKVDYYRNIGLKNLAMALIRKYMEKPRRVTLSQWDSKELSYEQVEYAAIDAYVSFELGMSLMKNGYGRRSGSSGYYNDHINVKKDGPIMDHYYDDPNPLMKNGIGRRSGGSGHYNDHINVNDGPIMDQYYDNLYRFDNLVICDQ